MGSSSLFFHLVVGYGSKFKYMGVFVDFLGFGRERKRTDAGEHDFSSPASTRPGEKLKKKKNPQCHSKRHRFWASSLLLLLFFLTFDETAPFHLKVNGVKICQFPNQSSICELFNLVPDSINSRPFIYTSFPVWFLVLNFFN